MYSIKNVRQMPDANALINLGLGVAGCNMSNVEILKSGTARSQIAFTPVWTGNCGFRNFIAHEIEEPCALPAHACSDARIPTGHQAR